MKWAFIVLTILLCGVVAFCLWGRKVTTYRDDKVSAGEITRPLNAFAVHLSKPKYIEVGGKTYTGVRGLPPYYLDVPQLNAILFVTQQKNYNVIFHLVNIETKYDVQIDAGNSGFGWNIGSGRTPGDKYTDYVESVHSNRMRLATRSGDWKETLELNLITKLIERRETLYFDAVGQVTNRSIQTNVTATNQ